GGALHGTGGGGQRRDPRRRAAGERPRRWGAGVPRGRQGGGVARRERRGLRGDAGRPLCGVHAVPRLPEARAQARVAGARPLRDLPPDRRHLHALRPRRPRRTAWVDPLRRRLGDGRRRHSLQDLRHRPLRRGLDSGLRSDGLARRRRDWAPRPIPAGRRARVAAGRRHRLHGRNVLLPPQDPLRARPLARLRAPRQRVPLRRHRPVRSNPWSL
ncbi:MAG: FIG01964566: Predicted membrane protein, hemolysin III homolog, partial [uncultured Rubrobacteraceae bacterium]